MGRKAADPFPVAGSLSGTAEIRVKIGHSGLAENSGFRPVLFSC